ncbi:hypothetical protein COV23_00945 [Candidatus Wolfebacteria bacterium CG10_big_fil_rev_8_21_14_0_10_31_9]|uniref:UDP-N-acetylglucosamine--N-acetylmuramyl-(pentapeptide) pyrophosphoryl-undecaprenol N-acetylglucosamine transferase n=1 Tax=Candidatus Wolfebacteria bacterium CG10_big_fil_rev_8_21_14_0_10_31_9 TaxID=1975070 RepID=A0A2H0RCD6_9BACT|nr:MAG: hypothetical protein COV23_00945 [Candidatus Wolfebacteria bacterium CG10_big_fil_rev_8_21_14_0_10_31_9]
MRILFTGGGTGGHIYPLLAVTEELKKIANQKRIELELYYLGVPESFVYLLENDSVKVLKTVSAKIRRYFDLKNLIDIPKFFIAVLQSFWKVFWLMPDVLFSKGGTGSLPVVMACRFYRIPIIIHESDSVAGLSNLIASKYAYRIGISFASTKDSFIDNFTKEKIVQRVLNKIALVGNPVRSFLINKNSQIDEETVKKNLGLDPQRPLILVLGGSQGATRINDFFLEIASELLADGYQVFHQTGIKNFDVFNKDLSSVLKDSPLKQYYQTVSYFDENIKDAYVAAYLVVSRAGSGSIFEIATMGKPSILIPLSESAYNHQVQNAFEYSKTGAAVVIEESNLKQGIFMAQIKKIFSNPDSLKRMSEFAEKFAKPDAGKIIAEEIIEVGEIN